MELQHGDYLARHGERISSRMAAFLGTNGFDELPVYAPIPVRCAFTGNEVITFGLPDPGQVRDAFGGFVGTPSPRPDAVRPRPAWPTSSPNSRPS